MPVSIEELRSHLQAFDFPRLFVEGLGWDHYVTEPFVVRVNERDYTLHPIAEKAGFAVYECDSSVDNNVPQYPVRRKIESEVAKRTFEHLIIFTDPGRKAQVWQWVRRESGKPAACREYAVTTGASGDHLLQRIQPLFVSLDEEPSLNIALVASRVRAALDVEKITKRFYERFQKELKDFGKFIEGIVAQGDRDWYASLMLNRMMFVYFVQKQGFLDEDYDYLRNRLKMVQEQSGGGRFQQFYRLFLLRLFHEGLGQPDAQRAPDLAALLGRVPFLNGGLFDVHDLERDNPDISIPDAAFERVFDFFDGYRWHLDERPHREDNEINPDVLGYIFEKYVNQKQMGAYYTKEDITGYISRNTVIPFLFDAARKECPVAFGPDGGVWRLLRDDPDRYIYPAVGHGIAWNARQPEAPERLEAPFDLPEDIAVGINDMSKRGRWNAPAPEDYALPTETWREVVARRTRYEEVRAKLAYGEVQEINDLITLNLDVERFARDVIAQSEGPELLRAFWHALYGNQERSDTGISVLDPTCGSGAFLFAALNILEPLYTACLEGMRGFLDDAERSERKRSPEHLGDFRRILEQVDKHPNERYFILKSIVLNNLYGVDIMEEAVEICKLRLFLKLVAQLESYDQIEPLPDIDFNVRAGNTLVGFTSLEAVREAMRSERRKGAKQARMLSPEQEAQLKDIEERAEEAKRIFDQFRIQQTMLGGEVTSNDKQILRDRLSSLDDELDRLMAAEYGVDIKKAAAYDAWRASHHPFHWFVEFYGIMTKGGFDVVIGNPPYVATKKVPYSFTASEGDEYSDIYAHILLQSMVLTTRMGRCSMIVPLSVTFSRDFMSLRSRLCDWGASWFSSYDNIPAALFSGVSQRCTIWVGNHLAAGTSVAPMYRWRSAHRPHLMVNLSYASTEGFDVAGFGLPKVADVTQATVLASLSAPNLSKHRSVVRGSIGDQAQLRFSQAARNFVSVFREEPPCLDAASLRKVGASKIGSLKLFSDDDTYAALASLSGELYFWYWLVRGDGFDVTSWLVRDYLTMLDFLPPEHYRFLTGLGRILDVERNRWLVFKKNAGRYVGNFSYRGASYITRRADLLILNGLSRTRDESLGLLDYVQQVLAINEYAGEKGIPASVKAMFPIPQTDPRESRQTFTDIDALLADRFSFTDEELDSIINHGTKYRMGRES